MEGFCIWTLHPPFPVLIDFSRIRSSDYEEWFQLEARVDKNTVNVWISMQIFHSSLNLKPLFAGIQA